MTSRATLTLALIVLMLSIAACATTPGSVSTPNAAAPTIARPTPTHLTRPQFVSTPSAAVPTTAPSTSTPESTATVDLAPTATSSGSDLTPPAMSGASDNVSLTPLATTTTVQNPTSTPILVPEATPTISQSTAALPSQIARPATAVAPASNPTLPAQRSAGGPVRLRIPKIGVDAPISPVGLDARGGLATPTTAFSVGWYDLGALPGQPGNAVLDGHLDSAIYGAAVFWRLGELRPGDSIVVQMSTGAPLTFLVEQEAVYPYDGAPMGLIFGPSSSVNLNLITCTGIFNRASHNYDRRLVVFARLAADHLPP